MSASISQPQPDSAGNAAPKPTPSSQPKVLVVDDSKETRTLLKMALSRSGLDVVCSEDGSSALKTVFSYLPDLILLDLNLPDMNGFDVCRRLKESSTTHDIPVVMLTGMDSVPDRVQGFSLGITDYISKPVDISELRARITAHLQHKLEFEQTQRKTLGEKQRAENQLHDTQLRFEALAENSYDLIYELDEQGHIVYLSPNVATVLGFPSTTLLCTLFTERLHPEERVEVETAIQGLLHQESSVRLIFRYLIKPDKWLWFETTGKSFTTTDTKRHIVLVARDITEQKTTEERLSYLATHDSLTGFFNRHYILQVLREGKDLIKGVLLYIDMDNFKVVNDTLGHAAGDRLICQFSAILADCIRPCDLLGRHGGDELVIFYRDVTPETAVPLVERLREAVELFRFIEGEQCFRITVSIGAVHIDGLSSADEILSHADVACYTAKREGGDRLSWYHPDRAQITQLRQESDWIPRVKDAMKNHSIKLWFQPVFHIPTHHVVYHEALMRLQEADGQWISPGAFLGAMERFGQITQIDRYVIREAVAHLQSNPSLETAINLSGHSIVDPELAPFIEKCFDAAGIRSQRVIFEITETAFMSNMGQARITVDRLRKLGFRFALDDFGAGFSSMAVLRDLPIDIVKIDGSFVRGMRKELSLNGVLVNAMNHIAHHLEMKTVAEHVEDQKTLDALASMQIDYAQGNFLGAAKPISENFPKPGSR